ncbi:MAG: alpha/beta fold hydrolase [Egibacteraceae bacterium]
MAKETRDDRTDAQHVRERLLAATPLAERHEPLAGVFTAILEGGDGPPMVLLHGPGEFAAVWTRVIPDLVATHHVVAPDLPGHGASGLPDGRLDVERVVAWLDALIEQTCATPPVLVGRMLGGAIAARYAVDHGDRVHRLVLVDSFGLAPYRPTPAFALTVAAVQVRQSERTFARLMNACYVDPTAIHRDLAETWEWITAYGLDRSRTSNTKTALRPLLPILALRRIPAADLAGIAVPTTLIHGREDLSVRLQVAESASARFGWPLYVIDGARDDPPLEQPAAFVAALRSALAEGPTRFDKEDAS